MKKVNIKLQTILWLIAGFISIIAIIFCSLIVHRITYGVEIVKNIDTSDILDGYFIYKAYSIGILVFASLILIMSISISYLGFKSWNYNAVL